MKAERFENLVALLKELFQLDKPELDFGFYRIMHSRSAEVTGFLENELLPQVRAALEEYVSVDRAQIERALQEATDQARSLGVDPDATDKVKALKAKRAQAGDLEAVEADVYDHLYRFFRRYYKDGDFISQRVYKDGVYAIPYQGEEVKLHWANADQYYIKTDEYLRNYSFRLRPDDETDPMRVHFRLADAAEGEHGNVKAADDRKRVFALADGDFAADEPSDSGTSELVLRFEYRPATMDDWPESDRPGKTKAPNQKSLLDIAEARIFKSGVTEPHLRRWTAALERKHVKQNGERSETSRLRTHLDRYTARNTFDYFIHKDLGGFLGRELDFYIKNEVMRLDDIENDTAPRAEQYLSKIRAIRRVAGTIIDFLASLENFQKRLWLKKKFVVETSYCIRLGCIPDEFLPEIAANDAQRREWVELCGIDEIRGDSTTPGYSKPLTVEFLRSQPTLMVSTSHFNTDRGADLLRSAGDLGHPGGLLVRAENFQSLSLMQSRYRDRVKCAYVDPPYNTEQDRTQGKFLYKDSYSESTWLAMIHCRTVPARALLARNGCHYVSIDDVMYGGLLEVQNQVFGRGNHIATVIWEKVHTRKNSAAHFSTSHDYVTCFSAGNKTEWDRVLFPRESTTQYTNPDDDPRGPWKSDPVYANNPYDADYTITKPNGTILHPPLGQYWRLSEATWKEKVRSDAVVWGDGAGYPTVKRFLRDVQDGLVPVTLFRRSFAGDNSYANAELDALFGPNRVFSYPKPTLLVQRLFQTCIRSTGQELALDYFAGSGTTGHAVINLNREDGGDRRFILVEMGEHFDTVLLPRLKKVTYSPEWKDGKPMRQATAEEAERSPDILKVIRLESYEDTLNNLRPAKAVDGGAERTASGASGSKHRLTPPPDNFVAHFARSLIGREIGRSRPPLPSRRRRPARRIAPRRGAVRRPDGVHTQYQATRFGREPGNPGRPPRDIQLAARPPGLSALGAPGGRGGVRERL